MGVFVMMVALVTRAWAGPREDAMTLAGWDGDSTLGAPHLQRLRDAFRSGSYTTEQRQQVLDALSGTPVALRLQVINVRDGKITADLDSGVLSLPEVTLGGLSSDALYQLQSMRWYTFYGTFAGGDAVTPVTFAVRASRYE